MSPRRGPLTERERQDWALFVQHVQPLPGRSAPQPATPEPVSAAIPATSTSPPPEPALPQPPPARPAPSWLGVGAEPAGLDRSTWTRFSGGRLAPVRTLDLHGRTAQAAFHAFLGFVEAAHRDRVRVVEIITGRGSGEAGGVIRRELPLWLNLPALRPLILAASHPHAANPGAVRLLLRKPR